MMYLRSVRARFETLLGGWPRRPPDGRALLADSALVPGQMRVDTDDAGNGADEPRQHLRIAARVEASGKADLTVVDLDLEGAAVDPHPALDHRVPDLVHDLGVRAHEGANEVGARHDPDQLAVAHD